MRYAATIAGLILALAMAIWWWGRGSEVAAGHVAAAPSRWSPPLTPATSPTLAKTATRGAWTQSEQDLAWCQLPGEWTSDREPSDAELERVKAALAASDVQSRAETERVHALWREQLRTQGDGQSQAAADLLDPDAAAKRHLFDLARNTQDPVVYGWAMAACLKQGPCELSARRWIQLDPGNLAAWLAEAQQAQQRGDVQAVREALYQIGLAQRNDDYGRRLMSMEYAMAQADRPGLQMATEILQPLSDLIALRIQGVELIRYCSAAGVKSDPSRQGSCVAAGDSLWRQADDPWQAQLALAWARHSAPQDEAVWAQRKAELDLLQAKALKLSDRAFGGFHRDGNFCSGLLEARPYFTAAAAIGQLAALRQAVVERE